MEGSIKNEHKHTFSSATAWLSYMPLHVSNLGVAFKTPLREAQKPLLSKLPFVRHAVHRDQNILTGLSITEEEQRMPGGTMPKGTYFDLAKSGKGSISKFMPLCLTRKDRRKRLQRQRKQHVRRSGGVKGRPVWALWESPWDLMQVSNLSFIDGWSSGVPREQAMRCSFVNENAR